MVESLDEMIDVETTVINTTLYIDTEFHV